MCQTKTSMLICIRTSYWNKSKKDLDKSFVHLDGEMNLNSDKATKEKCYNNLQFRLETKSSSNKDFNYNH